MTQKLIALALFTISITSTYAQKQRPQDKSPKPGVVKGQVIDANSNKPVEYANIAVYNLQDSSLVNGSVSDAKGRFKVAQIGLGKYYVTANFIGYKQKNLGNVHFTPQNQQHTFKEVHLQKAANELDNIDVVADRNRVEYKIDKKVINVGQDITASGGTAVDALENVPSVQVDIEGNVQLRGSGDFKVLVDGKPTALDGSDALQQLPVSSIKNIEIITNPSAKYDPEGTAGIINVVTKANKRRGLNGVINASAGLRDKYSGDFLLNYRVGKVNIFGGADYRNDNYYMNGSSFRESDLSTDSTDITAILEKDNTRRMRRKGYSVNAGFDYHISEQQTLSFTGKYGEWGFGWDQENQAHYFTRPQNTNEERYYIAEDEFDITRNYINLTLNYSQKFDSKNHKLEVTAYFSDAGIGDKDSNAEFPTDDAFNRNTGMDPYRLKSSEEGKRMHSRLKIDYTRPLSKGKLEAGYQGKLHNKNEDYTLNVFASDANDWNTLSTSDIDMYRHTQALYATYSAKFGKLGVMAGLRGEYTDRLLKQQTQNEEYRVHRTDLFPSGHISYKLPAKQQLQLSYSRRLNRPRGWYLDPLEQYQDRYNIRIGNPDLQPEFTDSYELSYQKRFGMSFISLEGFHKVKHNLITRLRDLRNDGVMIHTFGNVNNDYSSGLELMVNAELFKWWRLNASVSGYKYRIEGNISDQDVSRTSNNWDGRLNNTFKLPTNTRIQLMGFYRGPSVTAQGTRESMFFTSFAVKQQFLDRAASLTLQVRDPFGTMQHKRTAEGNNYVMENTFNRESPMVSLNFSYRINNYKKKRSKRGEGESFEGMGGGM